MKHRRLKRSRTFNFDSVQLWQKLVLRRPSTSQSIKAQTPTPNKEGVNINREKYHQIEQAILDVLSEEDEIEFKNLPAAVEKRLTTPFKGSVSLYIATVKPDMETRGIIERIAGSPSQQLRLCKTSGIE